MLMSRKISVLRQRLGGGHQLRTSSVTQPDDRDSVRERSGRVVIPGDRNLPVPGSRSRSEPLRARWVWVFEGFDQVLVGELRIHGTQFLHNLDSQTWVVVLHGQPQHSGNFLLVTCPTQLSQQVDGTCPHSPISVLQHPHQHMKL